MKPFIFLLTLLLAACSIEEEVNTVEPNELVPFTETVQQDDETEAVDNEEDGAEVLEVPEEPTGIIITGDTYVVQPGDTLSDIAMAAGIDLGTLMRWNVLSNANAIFVGEEIVLTGAPVIEYADAVVANVVMDTKNYLSTLEDGRYWNASFLNSLDISHLYLQYLRIGGEPRDIDAFVNHLFDHAPILANWQELAMTIYSPLGVNAFEPVPGRPGYFYALDTKNPDLLIGIINSRTGELKE